jgi:hypothetical protein
MTIEVDARVWRPNEWLKAAGNPFSRPTLYAEIHRGRTTRGSAAAAPSS